MCSYSKIERSTQKFVELNSGDCDPVLVYTNQCCNATNDTLRNMIFSDTRGFEGQRFIKDDRIVFNNAFKSLSIIEADGAKSAKIFHTYQQVTVRKTDTLCEKL